MNVWQSFLRYRIREYCVSYREKKPFGRRCTVRGEVNSCDAAPLARNKSCAV